MEDFNYYDWNRTLAYDAFLTIVISERGLGKTYGLKKQCVKDFLKTGQPFAVVCRHKNQLPDVENGFFEKFHELGEFERYVFKTESDCAYVAPRPECDGDKPKWELCGYFVALTNWQNDKMRTFKRPRRIIFDEFLIDRKSTPYMHYLPNEYTVLLNEFSTLVREKPGETANSRIYLLGNACDLVNPYFEALGIDAPPEKNTYTWYNGKTALLHYCADEAHGRIMSDDSIVGKLMRGQSGAGIMFATDFEAVTGAYVAKKPARAKFDTALVYRNDLFGVWLDKVQYLYYVTSKTPNGSGFTTCALTKDDGAINRLAVKKLDPYLQALKELHYQGCVRYESDAIRERFFAVLGWLGVA